MKLQSNKNKPIISLSLLSCLACLLLGSTTSAAYASLPEESFSHSTQTVTVSTEGQKSLADFGKVLGQRLVGVWQEVRGLVSGGVASRPTFSQSTSVHNAPSQAIAVSGLVSTGTVSYFSDLTAPHDRYINLLAKEGIVLGNQGKFYPDNYLRLYDLIKMTVDLYRVKVGYDVSGEQGLSLIGAFSGDDSLPSRYVATALHLGFLSHIEPLDFQKFVSSEDFIQILANVSYEFSGMVRLLSVERSDVITRGEAAEYLVMARDLSANGIAPYQSGQILTQTPFLDIYAHPYQIAISTLAQRGIVTTDSPKFYPDNYLHRYDFTIMFVNALLYGDNKTLNAAYLSGFGSPFVDVRTGSYSPFVFYAYDHHLIDFLIVNKRGENYFLPDNLITKHEIYTIVGRATGKTFTYDIQQADQSYMTRGEFAQVLVDLFDITPPEVQSVSVASGADTGSGGLLDKLSIFLQIKELFAKL